MKRNKIKKLIGQVSIIVGFHAIWIGLIVYGFMTATTLN